MKPAFAFSADNHLDRHAWASRPDLAGDSVQSFVQTVDYCVRHHLPLALGGDVLHEAYPDPATVMIACGQLERLSADGLSFYFVQGQHELHRDVPWLRLASGYDYVHGRRFFPAGIPCYGLDFQPADRLPAALAGIPAGTRVLLCHQVWEEWMGSVTAPEGALRDVPRVRLVLTGDFHGHQVLNLTAADGRPLRVASPGSQSLRAITEDPAKYFYVVNDDLTVTSVPLRTRPREWHTLRDAAAFADALAVLVHRAARDPDPSLPEALHKPVFVVEFGEDVPEAKRRIEAALDGRVHLFTRPAGRRRTAVEAAAPDGGADLSLAGRLAARYREADPAVYATAKRLLDAADPRAELVAVLDGILNAPATPDDPWAVPPEEPPQLPPTTLGID